MGVAVSFVYADWIAAFPQFTSIPQGTVTGIILPIAQLYLRNDGGGPVCDAATQTALLNLIVAHVAQLLWGVNGQPPSPVVGRLSSATEGSVSVATEFPMTANSAWFQQTPFGAAFWQATAAFRLGVYVPGSLPQYSNTLWPFGGAWGVIPLGVWSGAYGNC